MQCSFSLGFLEESAKPGCLALILLEQDVSSITDVPLGWEAVTLLSRVTNR